jgi:hypothetical protein
VLPPRIERGGEPEHEPAPAPVPELPPRIEHSPAPPPTPAPAPPPAPVAVTDVPEPFYVPRHARDAEPEEEAEHQPEPEPQPEPESAAVAAATPAPVAPVRPDPLASPVKNTLRAHQRLAYILAAVIIIAGAGFWALRVHERIGQHALESGVAKQQQGASAVKCAALQSNGAAWACAVVYKAESVCLIARVNLLGSWSTKTRAGQQHRCDRIPALAALAPKAITATMVGADIDRREGRSDFACAKLPSHKVRWACERPLETGGQCLVVRVIQWTSWNVLDGGKSCAHDPDLQKALKHGSSSA